jgi:PadR family transcriptional regulator, regulatory protein PadR
MGSRSEFSPQTLAVLVALGEQPSAWQHGYALAQQTGLKSGTLYPILIRLADQSLVEACWQSEPVPGRPRRHLYRLTSDGLATAVAVRGAMAAAVQTGAVPAGVKSADAKRRPGVVPRRGRDVAAPVLP